MPLNTYGSYKPEDKPETPTRRRIIILGPHAWGRGDTEKQALSAYKKNRYVLDPHEAIVIDADWRATVDEMGMVTRPTEAPPSKELKRIQIPKF